MDFITGKTNLMRKENGDNCLFAGTSGRLHKWGDASDIMTTDAKILSNSGILLLTSKKKLP